MASYALQRHLWWRTQAAWANFFLHVSSSYAKERAKLVITMASYALQRHLGWRMQSRLGQNNGSLLTPTFRVAESKVALCPQLEALQRRYSHFVA